MLIKNILFVVGSTYCDTYFFYGTLCYCKENGVVKPTKGTTCRDINECAVDNGNCEHRCTNRPGGRTCSCNPGYQLTSNGRGCEDIDECSGNSHGCSDMCINTPGGYYCGCPDNKEMVQGSRAPLASTCSINTRKFIKFSNCLLHVLTTPIFFTNLMFFFFI